MSKSSRPTTISYPGMAAQGRSALLVERVALGAGASALRIQLHADVYPVPEKEIVADYVDLRVTDEGVRIICGKRDSFSDDKNVVLHYALEIGFPFAQFVNQLASSITTPAEPGALAFIESVRRACEQAGYPTTAKMPLAVRAEKQAHIRANAAAMYMFGDEVCVDFIYLDAHTLQRAAAGKEVTEFSNLVRVVMAPNLLLYFVRRIIEVAAEVKQRVPALAKEEPLHA